MALLKVAAWISQRVISLSFLLKDWKQHMKDHCILNFTLSQKLKLNVKNESYSSKLSKRMDFFFYFRRFCLDICTLESVML